MEVLKYVSEAVEEKEARVRESRGGVKGPRMRWRADRKSKGIDLLQDMLSAMCCHCIHNNPDIQLQGCNQTINARLNCVDKDNLYKFFDDRPRIKVPPIL